ncbi:GAF domain-containing sensor histidine kinase [Cereibacter sp. SYSU M97828]|nr:GAF domain-containing sensor histidine kinase [Cereibacter flavus]
MTGSENFEEDVQLVQSIGQVPRILEVCQNLTGMRFVTVAKVTDRSWVACATLDGMGFDLRPGGELPLNSTICDEIRDSRKLVVFDDADRDATFSGHHTPRIYGLKSYISVPIVLKDGSFFGTLCGIDSVPRIVNTPQVIDTFQLFADLIASLISDRQDLLSSENALHSERKVARLREEFIAVLGHDLRNPLTSLKSGLRLLHKPGADVEMLASEMSKTTNRMSAIVENLLDLARARFGAGMVLETREETHVNNLAAEIAQEIFSATGKTIDVDAVAPVRILCDPSQIGRMISNLANNAVIHGARDRPVQISISSDGRAAVIAVRNHGEPIPADKMASLFEPFVRGASPSANGLGLGLFISSEIARAHGGSLTVSSDADQTEFRFCIPL